MLPNNGNIEDLTVDLTKENDKTQTFGINTKNNLIFGKIDELEAVMQSVYLMLSIEADQHIIYPYTYGVNTRDLIGKPTHYVVAILPSRIKETLLKDDRITDVSDFEFRVIKNTVHVQFNIHTIYGNSTKSMEVTV